ncbi:MAG TPA: hypothetical protein VGT01_10720 [Candidatus Dormibacteraeota bacterium]|nr:hypothetical protein [Candidatus Dormibacteraeota bacterium]
MKSIGVKPLLVTAMCLVLWRLLLQIPLLDLTRGFLLLRTQGVTAPGFFASIGYPSLPIASYSAGEIGIGPYVAAIVIVGLVQCVRPELRRMSLERWTTAIGLLLALGQSYGWTALVQSSGALSPGDWTMRLVISLELTAGTAITILLANTLDEHGLGFGYGAVLLYALGALGIELHRLADFLATLTVEGLYRPLEIWAAFTLGVAIAAIAILLAVRRIAVPARKGRGKNSAPVELRLMMSGVMRPAQFAFAIASLPAIASQFYPVTSAVTQFAYGWSPYSPNRWVGIAFVSTEATLVVFFAYFVAAYDWALLPGSPELRPHAIRLGLLGGLMLALLVVAAPMADHVLTQNAGQVIPMSGADVLLVVAVILIIVRVIEGQRLVAPLTASPSRLP